MLLDVREGGLPPLCSVCGIKSFYVPRSNPDGYSVNARCLDEGTLRKMTIVPLDGRNWERTYGRA